jgi:hypothetical protein
MAENAVCGRAARPQLTFHSQRLAGIIPQTGGKTNYPPPNLGGGSSGATAHGASLEDAGLSHARRQIYFDSRKERGNVTGRAVD